MVAPCTWRTGATDERLPGIARDVLPGF